MRRVLLTPQTLGYVTQTLRKDAPLILIGNKVDLERYRQVSKTEGSSLAHFYNATFFETSAAEEFSSVERVFHEAIREVIREQERYMPVRSLYIANDESKSGNNFLTINDDLSRGQMVAAMPKLDEGTLGENLVDVTYNEQTGLFPDRNTPNKLFDGVRYADLPICHIKSSPNNTIISLTDSTGVVKSSHSCGKEGFKNTREGTNIAAQATAITLSTRGVSMGYKTVRVTVSGLGPGRMAAIKGLTMGGMNVVSITDRTPVSWSNNPRPKKRRKL
nr:EOG090X0DZ9 [Scapholeberis mucronata]